MSWKHPGILSLLLALMVAGAAPAQVLDSPARRGDHIDDYHGLAIPDPYRWMEDLGAPELHEWMQGQEALLEAFLKEVPEGAEILARVQALSDFDAQGMWVDPARGPGGDRLFYTSVDRGSGKLTLWVLEPDGTRRRLAGTGTSLNMLGTVFSSWQSPSPDGEKIAFPVARRIDGSNRVGILDVATGELLESAISFDARIGSLNWHPDGESLFYTQPTEDLTGGARILLHRVGTQAETDQLIFDRPDLPEWSFYVYLIEDRIVVVGSGNGEEASVRTMGLGGENPRVIMSPSESSLSLLGGSGGALWFLTTVDAPNRRIVAVDLDQPDHLRELIPESEWPITFANAIGESLLVRYEVESKPTVRIFNHKGEMTGQARFPSNGEPVAFRASPDGRRAYCTVISNVEARAIYVLDLESSEGTPVLRPDVPYDPSDFAFRRSFYPSPGGRAVPVFLVYKRGMVLDGSRPTLLSTSGANGGLTFPGMYSPMIVAWLERGGLFAHADVRGSGVYGQSWAEAGSGRNRQHGIDDFCAAAEWLVDVGYTRADRIAVYGGSAGALTAINAALQRPELFGAAVLNVPALDMLQYARNRSATGSTRWIELYGDPMDPSDLETVLGISPLHQLRPGRDYPALMVQVGESDSVYAPSHGYKFVATAQALGIEQVLKISRGAGHAIGRNPEETARTQGEQLSFLFKALGLGSGRR